MQKTKEKGKKQKLFQNLFNMAYQPVIVGTKSTQGYKKQYTTLFAAINNVQQHVMIKINPGVYNQRILIKKPDIKIQAAQISQNSIIGNTQHPNMIIQLPKQQDKIYLQYLKFINTCENTAKHEIINSSYQNIKKQDYLNFKTDIGTNSCLYIKKGIVQLEQCKISMSIYHNKQNTIPCIVIEKQGTLIINRSEIRGGGGTIGIFCNGGKLIMKQTIIRDHGVAGLLYTSKQQNNATNTNNTNISNNNNNNISNTNKINLVIKNSSFIRCNQGIVLNGPFQSLLQNNTISQSNNIGLVLNNGNKCRIKNNQIKLCKIGIQIKNSFPIVLKNTITNNIQGFNIKSRGGILCRPMLKFNTINENSNGGIYLQGSLNKSKLQNNYLTYNNKYAIKIQNHANPHIFLNKINNTIGNGVIILKNCNVFLQKNDIQNSTQSNIVIEGPNNINNFIYRNYINKARSQGIFTIYGEKFTIKDNQIINNYNGIISITGVQNIQSNSIAKNQKNGILLLSDNYVNIVDNQIQFNKKAGIFIRGSSVGKIEDNYFNKNKSQIVIQNQDKAFQNIQKENAFQDEYDIRIPKNYSCNVM